MCGLATVDICNVNPESINLDYFHQMVMIDY